MEPTTTTPSRIIFKNPLVETPVVVRMLSQAGFIITETDQIIRYKNNLILRKKLGGENPDGSPRFYDIPLQLQQQTLDEALASLPTKEETALQETTIKTLTTETTPDIIQENQNTNSSQPFGTIAGATVYVGQMLAQKNTIIVFDFFMKDSVPYVTLLDIETGKEISLSIAELETVTTLPELIKLFSTYGI